MIRLVRYIIFVFLPTFLAVKHHGLFHHGPYHLLQEVKAVDKYLNEEEKEVVRRIIKVNGFFGHQENIIIALLCSNSIEERSLGVSTILNIRRKGEPEWPRANKGIRPFKVTRN